MTIQELIKSAIKKLSNSASPSLDGEVLLSHVLDKPKEYLLANPDKKIWPEDEKKFRVLLNRRSKGWPVPYLTNKQEFRGLKFHIDKNVLIPRPETEGLVEIVLKYIHNKNLKILDIGTGSGAIIVSLAKNLQGKFFASDISLKALKIAGQNAKDHKVQITFKQGSLLKPWKKQQFDIIVANLPYLSRQTDPSTKFEPKNSLIAKKNGLGLFEQLFRSLPSSLHSLPSFIFLEIGHSQAAAINKLAKKYLPAYQTKIYKDLSGRNRYAVLQLL